MTFLSFFLLIGCSADNNSDLTIGVSTTLEQSGLSKQLIEQFTQEYDLRINTIVVTEQNAPTLLHTQNIDVAITPINTKTLDNSLNYHALFTSDYFIAGEKGDRAHIKHSLTTDEAIKKIANTQGKWIAQNEMSDVYAIEQQWLSDNKLLTETSTENQQQLIDKANRLSAYFLIDKPSWLMIEDTQDSIQLFSEEDSLILTYGTLSLHDQVNQEHIKQWTTWLNSDAAKVIIANYKINQQLSFTLKTSE